MASTYTTYGFKTEYPSRMGIEERSMRTSSLVPRRSSLEEGGGMPGTHCRSHAFNFEPVTEETKDGDFQSVGFY